MNPNSRLLDVIQMCEGALLDHAASESGLDVALASSIAEMCRDALLANGRVSVMVESSKQPET